MESSNRSVLRFDVHERISLFTQGRAIKEVVNLELLPEVRVYNEGNQVLIQGFLLLQGEYVGEEGSEAHSVEEKVQLLDYDLGEEGPDEGLEPLARSDHPDAPRVEELQSLVHRIPLEIRASAERIPSLESIQTEIEGFDFDQTGPQEIEIVAEVVLKGLRLEQDRFSFDNYHAVSYVEVPKPIQGEGENVPEEAPSLEGCEPGGGDPKVIPLPRKRSEAEPEEVEVFPARFTVESSAGEDGREDGRIDLSARVPEGERQEQGDEEPVEESKGVVELAGAPADGRNDTLHVAAAAAHEQQGMEELQDERSPLHAEAAHGEGEEAAERAERSERSEDDSLESERLDTHVSIAAKAEEQAERISLYRFFNQMEVRKSSSASAESQDAPAKLDERAEGKDEVLEANGKGAAEASGIAEESADTLEEEGRDLANLSYWHRYLLKKEEGRIRKSMRWHRAVSGETPGLVAEKYSVSVAELLRYNRLTDEAEILPEGRLLRLP